MSHRMTERQLEVMNVVWEKDGATVRDVKDELDPDDEQAYTTFLTILQTLEKRDAVEPERQGKHYVYHPKRSRREEARRWVDAMRKRDLWGEAMKAEGPVPMME